MNAEKIALALGDATREGHDWRCRCPVHDGRSLTLRDGKEGQLIAWCFAGCNTLDVLAEIRRRGFSRGVAPERQIRSSKVATVARANNVAPAMAIWRECVDATGTPVERYLVNRGLALPTRHSEAIRFHRACPFKGQRVPAMVALFRDIVTDEPCGIHRTALLPDGSDRDRTLGKAMLGRSGGAAIKLCPDDEVDLALGLSEGIETAVAILGIGWRPVWACGSADAMAQFPVLPGIEELTIFADRDPNRVGQNAGQACASRWIEACVPATVRLPQGIKADWCDVLARAA